MSASASLLIAWAGVVAGCHHAATGPDHVAAVLPIAVTRGKRAWRTGLVWGAGHALGAAFGAIAALALRSAVPGLEAHLSAVSETLVGILLCVVGVLGLRSWMRARATHAPRHEHRVPPSRAGTALGFGFVHGVAGLSHLFAIVPALALPGRVLPFVYLAGYALGSLALMTGFAAALGRAAPAERPERARAMLGVASAASIAVGLFWIAHPM